MTARAACPSAARQRGAALLVIFLIIMLAGLGMLFGRLNGNNLANEREQATSAALEQAREALIGYAATYGDSHSATHQVHGYLPCPDLTNDGGAETCGQKGFTVVGRLPWKTLGLPPLRDGDGECLWYAVSGSFKNNPKPDLLNWDSTGNLRVVDAQSGTVLVDADDIAGKDGGAAAVIFAPGPALVGQSRAAGNNQCGGDASNAYAAYIESGGFPASAMLTARQGRHGDDSVNDRLAWITPREIFARIRQRSDFTKQTTDRLQLLPSKLAATTPPAQTGSDLTASKLALAVPSGLLSDPTDVEWQEKWSDQMRYMLCPMEAACMTVNGTACQRALVFAGERSEGGPRTAAQRTALDAYFQGNNFSSSAATLSVALCVQ